MTSGRQLLLAANYPEHYFTPFIGDSKPSTDLTGTLRDQRVLWVSCSQRTGIAWWAIWYHLIMSAARTGKSRQIDEERLLLAGRSKREGVMSQSVEKQSEPSPTGAVLLVDEDLEQLGFVQGIIQGIGYSVQACNSYIEGLCQLVSGAFDIIVVGQGSRNFEGRCMLEGATEFNRRLPVVVVAQHLEMECYLEAMQLEAVDYLIRTH
jgi:CheY-like chemotaxis protein